MQALVHRSHHHTREHTTDLSDGCKDGSSLCDLKRFAVTSISRCGFRDMLHHSLPRSKDVDSSTIQTGLKESLEEANDT